MPNDQTNLPARQPTPRADRPCRVIDWRPWGRVNPVLAGHAAFEFSGGWQVASWPVFRGRDGTLSVGTPSSPILDVEGRQRIGLDGKRMYVALITFANSEARSRWMSPIAAIPLAPETNVADAMSRLLMAGTNNSLTDNGNTVTHGGPARRACPIHQTARNLR